MALLKFKLLDDLVLERAVLEVLEGFRSLVFLYGRERFEQILTCSQLGKALRRQLFSSPVEWDSWLARVEDLHKRLSNRRSVSSNEEGQPCLL